MLNMNAEPASVSNNSNSGAISPLFRYFSYKRSNTELKSSMFSNTFSNQPTNSILKGSNRLFEYSKPDTIAISIFC